MPRVTLIGLVALTACSSATAPDGWRRVIGRIEPAMSSVQAIKLPSEAVVNVPFVITATTLGSSSCTRSDGATSSVTGSLVVITPYDRVAPEGTACTRDLHSFPRDASVTLSSAGLATIRVVARDLNGELLTYEATLPVRGVR